MSRRLAIVVSVTSLFVVMLAGPANAIIHELVASHCAGHELPNNEANVDPPGQLNEKAFAAALQATGVYDLQFGVSQEGVLGQDFTEMPFPDEALEPLPAPPEGTIPVSVFVDNTKPSAKLGDTFVWGFFVDDGFAIYLQLYDLDHPAFDNCPGLIP